MLGARGDGRMRLRLLRRLLRAARLRVTSTKIGDGLERLVHLRPALGATGACLAHHLNGILRDRLDQRIARFAAVGGLARGGWDIHDAERLSIFAVTPKDGRAYVLIDHKGDGTFVKQDNTLSPHTAVPQWVVVEF